MPSFVTLPDRWLLWPNVDEWAVACYHALANLTQDSAHAIRYASGNALRSFILEQARAQEIFPFLAQRFQEAIFWTVEWSRCWGNHDGQKYGDLWWLKKLEERIAGGGQFCPVVVSSCDSLSYHGLEQAAKPCGFFDVILMLKCSGDTPSFLILRAIAKMI